MRTGRAGVASQPEKTGAPDAVVLRSIGKSFGDRTVLAGCNLVIQHGEVMTLLGGNGAGKSTLVDILLGLGRADSGYVEVLGGAAGSTNARQSTGVMFQDLMLPAELTVVELIDLVSSGYPEPLSTPTVVDSAGLHDLQRERYGRLSGGQRRQVQFALALCGNPRLLVLDEPTVGMDRRACQRVWAHLRAVSEGGQSVLLTTHSLEEAETCSTRVSVLQDGRCVAAGRISELRERIGDTTICCRTRLSADDVSRWPEVDSASHRLGLLVVCSGRPEAAVRRLLDADPFLSQLEVGRARLGDVLAAIEQERSA